LKLPHLAPLGKLDIQFFDGFNANLKDEIIYTNGGRKREEGQGKSRMSRSRLEAEED
jgi:hypothetical protein